MKKVVITLCENDLREKLFPRLRGRVFHVTTRSAFAAILECGMVRPNDTGQFPFTYEQSKNSYFRIRGYVSLFDLRSASNEQLDDALMKYNFLNPRFTEHRPVYLFFNCSCFALLTPWSKWKEDKAFSEMVIPYVEAGYPGEIDVGLISEALLVEVDPCEEALFG